MRQGAARFLALLPACWPCGKQSMSQAKRDALLAGALYLGLWAVYLAAKLWP